ncbi:MAG: RNA 3'-terminal phosphate cyclase [Candidatus Hydrogenedentes bacterium]|nr:RNA 3'-terminal phosphate cyclase [Candidatus Hydrogenedentota bacterium]
MLQIDGSQGEGGGQVLRTSLAMALVTGQPVHLINVRARRERPGLCRQHLTSVHAAAAVGNEEVEGAEIGSREVVFRPRAIVPGRHHFDIGTAGSTALVMQTVLPPLLTARGPSTIVLQGGTHNILAPPYEFLAHSFLPVISRMGPRLELTLDRLGFYPKGGGRMTMKIVPADRLEPFDLRDRGEIREVKATALVAGLPRHIADRELATAQSILHWPADALQVQEYHRLGPGNALSLQVYCEFITAVFTGFGVRGTSAEDVASEAAKYCRQWMEAGVPVDEHLADQLLIPMALAGGGRFRTMPLSLHTTTNMQVLEQFLPGTFTVNENEVGWASARHEKVT